MSASHELPPGRSTLRHLSPRTVINGTLLALGLMVLILAGLAARGAYLDHRQASRVETANRAAIGILTAAGIQARERGLTSLALGAGAPSAPDLRDRMDGLRRAGDAVWNRALRRVETLEQAESAGPGLPRAVRRARQAFGSLKEARQQADRALAGKGPAISGRGWFQSATRLIRETADLRDILLPAVDMPARMGRLSGPLQRRVWKAAENAGWERGTLAYYLAAGEPVPPLVRERLRTRHARLQDNLARLRERADHPTLSPRIRHAVHRSLTALEEDFPPLREAVLAQADSGDYPMGPHRWWREYTTAINTLLRTSSAIAAVTSEQARGLQRASTWSFAGFGGLGLLAVGLGGFGLTRVRRTANSLFRQKELAEVTIHSIGDAVITTDGQGRVEYLNPVAEDLTEWSSTKARGRAVAEVFPVVNGHTGRPVVNPAEACLSSGEVVDLANNSLLRRPDGGELAIEDSAAPIRDREGNVVGAVLVFYDVTRTSPHTQNLLAYRATHDPLTKLINRRELERRLAEVLTRAQQEGTEHALCYLDLDQFKLVNDTCGHKAGDQLLRQITYLLQGALPAGATLARLGGDEFALLVTEANAAQVRTVAEEILGIVRDFRFVWAERAFDLGGSIGICPITTDSASVAEVLSRADAACFAAKDAGGNRLRFYTEDDAELSRRHSQMEWVGRIRTALEEDRLELHCQPILPLAGTGSRQGEVLVRLREDDRLILPGEFIPAAERFRLMGEVDRWVVEAALANIGDYLAHSCSDRQLHCKINLSGPTLADPETVDFLREALRRHAVPPGMVCFEVTETAAIASFDRAVTLMTTLREEGVRFALDDFGSGLSSFAYLRNLPVDCLKIDGSLVAEVAEDAEARAMVRAIFDVARAMNLQTIAEHVHSEAAHRTLVELEIPYGQGFGLATPRPMAECLSECGEESRPATRA